MLPLRIWLFTLITFEGDNPVCTWIKTSSPNDTSPANLHQNVRYKTFYCSKSLQTTKILSLVVKYLNLNLHCVVFFSWSFPYIQQVSFCETDGFIQGGCDWFVHASYRWSLCQESFYFTVSTIWNQMKGKDIRCFWVLLKSFLIVHFKNILPVWTLYPTFRLFIVTDSPFSRLTVAVSGRHPLSPPPDGAGVGGGLVVGGGGITSCWAKSQNHF